jgi:hypothetical protein
MPRVHAIADGVGVYAVSLCGLIAMSFSIPGVGLFAICYRPVEGVFDLVAFRSAHDRATFDSQHCDE